MVRIAGPNSRAGLVGSRTGVTGVSTDWSGSIFGSTLIARVEMCLLITSRALQGQVVLT